MPKEIKTLIKLQIPGGQANPAPPVGPALGQHGLNISEFCQKFNEATRDRMGDVTPVEITVYMDRSYTFKLKTPPVSELLKKALQIQKGSAKPHTDKVGKVKRSQVQEIAKIKLPDLNTADIASAMSMVQGTARQMGIEVVED